MPEIMSCYFYAGIFVLFTFLLKNTKSNLKFNLFCLHIQARYVNISGNSDSK